MKVWGQPAKQIPLTIFLHDNGAVLVTVYQTKSFQIDPKFFQKVATEFKLWTTIGTKKVMGGELWTKLT